MSRVVIIGGSGHVGTYLVPRLVEAGFEVVNVSRGEREPYPPHAAWKAVETVTLDREAEEKAGTFGPKIRALKPDIVIDMICFTLGQREASRRGACAATCSISSMPGRSGCMGRASRCRRPRCSRASRSANTACRRRRSRLICSTRRGGTAFRRRSSIPATSSGRAGTRSIRPGISTRRSSRRSRSGKELALPNFGLETVHHVHADDVAQMFMRAIANWSASVGEAFHAVSPAAVTLRGYAEAMAAWFGQRGEADVPALAGMEGGAEERGRGDGDLGAHLPQPELAASPRRERLLGYAAALHLVRGGATRRSTWLIEQGIVKT